MIIIDCYPEDWTEPYLLFPAETGVTYTVQTGGNLCSHHQQEGFIIPLSFLTHEWKKLLDRIEDIHPGCCGDIIPLDYDLLQASLSKFCPCLRIDKSRPGTEAWLPLLCADKEMLARCHSESSLPCVLIWENCD
jgi:hypothetical protein